MLVIKRNGTAVEFDKQKIIRAVRGAYSDIGLNAGSIPEEVADKIESKAHDKISVEQIQDLVEFALLKRGEFDAAKAYITYRYKHQLIRDQNLYTEIGDKLAARNVQNQNANVDEKSFGGRISEAADALMRAYALENCVSRMARENHLNNEIYIHDLSHYVVGDHNCLSIPFDDLLANGFNTRQTDVRPANSVNTAFQLVAVIFQLQSLQQFGGCSATHLDWTMVPYVRISFNKHYKDGLHYIEQIIFEGMPEDVRNLPIDGDFYKELNYPNAYQYAMDMTIKEIHQAVEGMYHNLNTLQSRSGN